MLKKAVRRSMLGDMGAFKTSVLGPSKLRRAGQELFPHVSKTKLCLADN